MENTRPPEGILIVMAYHYLLGALLLLTAVATVFVAIPEVLPSVAWSGPFGSGLVVLVLTALLCAGLGGGILALTVRLRRPLYSARSGILILSVVVLTVSVLSIPVLLLTLWGGWVALLPPTLTAAAMTGASGATLLYLMRNQRVKAFYVQ